VNIMLEVFRAEFGRRLRSRAFIFGTIFGAAGILLLAVVQSSLGGMINSSSKRIVLVGEHALTAAAQPLLTHDFDIVATLPRLDAPPTATFLEAHGKASAIAVLSRGSGGLNVVAYTGDPSSFRQAFGRDLAPLQVALATGIPVGRVAGHVRVNVAVRDISGRFADADAADAAKGIAYLFVMLLYVAILLNAQSIMTSVAEEKTSRIAELLVATLDPAQLLAAKLVAAAATGFIQLGVWAVAGLLSGRAVTEMFSNADTPGVAGSIATMDISSGEVLAFVAFFVLGFTQFGVLYAAAASLINRTEDIGSVAGPLTVPVVIGIILAVVGLQFPNAPNIVVCSFVPLISPFVMFTRIAVSNVPVWQIVLSLLINVATAVLLAWLAGKIYRVGLLMYGRPPSFKQIVATLRT
jgi:ABC-2 type transport system permease protein